MTNQIRAVIVLKLLLRRKRGQDQVALSARGWGNKSALINHSPWTNSSRRCFVIALPMTNPTICLPLADLLLVSTSVATAKTKHNQDGAMTRRTSGRSQLEAVRLLIQVILQSAEAHTHETFAGVAGSFISDNSAAGNGIASIARWSPASGLVWVRSSPLAELLLRCQAILIGAKPAGTMNPGTTFDTNAEVPVKFVGAEWRISWTSANPRSAETEIPRGISFTRSEHRLRAIDRTPAAAVSNHSRHIVDCPSTCR